MISNILDVRFDGAGELLDGRFADTHTSITDKAGRKPVPVGLTLLIVLRLTLIAEMDPPDIHNIMTVIFLG